MEGGNKSFWCLGGDSDAVKALKYELMNEWMKEEKLWVGKESKNAIGTERVGVLPLNDKGDGFGKLNKTELRPLYT